MKTITNISRSGGSKRLTLPSCKRNVFSYCLGFIILLSTIGISSPQVNASENIVEFSATKSETNLYYFIQQPIANITILAKSNILFNTNVILHNNIDGDGSLIFSSNKKLTIDANGNRINNVLVKSNTMIGLKGHLQIMRNFRVEEGVRIILNNSNLTLHPEIIFVKSNQICQNAMGQFICSSNKTNSLNVLSLNFDTSSTTGLTNSHSSEISFSQMNSCSAFYLREIFSLLFIDTEIPPPKV